MTDPIVRVNEKVQPLDVASIIPKVDPLAVYAHQQMKAALDALTDEIFADYIKNHLLNRGAPVGNA